MSDDKQKNPKQAHATGANAHGGEQEHQRDAARKKAASEATKVGAEILLRPVEHQVVRVTVPVAIQIAEEVNKVLDKLPKKTAEDVEKAVAQGKMAKGLLKYAHGSGIVAVSGVAGVVEFTIATELLHEHKNTAAADAVTGTFVGGSAMFAGARLATASGLALVASELVREGLHAMGYHVEPSVTRQTVEGHLNSIPGRLLQEMTVNEARAMLQDKDSPEYKTLIASFREDYARKIDKLHGNIPPGFPATADEYVSGKVGKVINSLLSMDGDRPSGILKQGKGLTKDKIAELGPMYDDASTRVAEAMEQSVEPPPTTGTASPPAITTAPAQPNPTAATISRADTPANAMFAALLAANDFKFSATGCKASDTEKANLGCMPIQQTVAQEQSQVAEAAR